MELSNSARNQTHRLNIIFSYRYWRRTDNAVNSELTQEIPSLQVPRAPEPPFTNYTNVGNQNSLGLISDIVAP